VRGRASRSREPAPHVPAHAARENGSKVGEAVAELEASPASLSLRARGEGRAVRVGQIARTSRPLATRALAAAAHGTPPT
jgi:hypothetical protein